MVFLLILFILILIFIFSKIRVEIERFEFISNRRNHINKDYKLIFKFCILGKIPIIKIEITKKKLEKLNIKEKVKNIDFKDIQNNMNIDKKNLIALKELKIGIKKLNLKMDIGTENAVLTSMIIPIISTLIAIFISKNVKNTKEQSFIINPIYINQNLINIVLSGIVEIKMIHIINIIYILNKKEGVSKNERTSDRGTYDYSYE